MAEDSRVERTAKFLNRRFGPEMNAGGGRVNWSHHTADDKEAYRQDARDVLRFVDSLPFDSQEPSDG